MTDTPMPNLPAVLKESIHEKGWGQERWIENNDKYCLKILEFDKKARFSLHFHKEKDETWFVDKGEFILEIVDLRDASHHQFSLEEGQIIRIFPGIPHRLSTETGGKIIEVSTTHEDFDSYRIEPGDSQQ